MTEGGHINPERTQFEAFKALPRDTPVNMLNLVRVRDQAEYPDGRQSTGREAYEAYGRESAPVLNRVGGSILWRGSFETALIGPPQERWDFCFIARYPTAGAFLAMVTDPDYQQAVIHRTASVADSRLIRMGELSGGPGFAG
ncbi:MAG: DUF1330 domain-containing protein [Pseudomonadota bacterium]